MHAAAAGPLNVNAGHGRHTPPRAGENVPAAQGSVYNDTAVDEYAYPATAAWNGKPHCTIVMYTRFQGP